MSTNSYYSIANEEYLFLKSSVHSNIYNSIAFLAEQVVEKYLKHVVQEFCVGHPEAEVVLKTHNLPKLDYVIKESGIDLGLDIRDLRMLKDFYFDARYPGENYIRVSKEEANECIAIVDYVKRKVANFIESEGYCKICGSKLLSTGKCSNFDCDGNL